MNDSEVTWSEWASSGNLFFFWLVLLLGGLLLLGAWKRVYPHSSLLVLVAFPTLLTLGLYLRPDLGRLVVLVDVVVAGIAIADLLTLPTARSFTVRREMLQVASLQKPHRVAIVIQNMTNRPRLVWVRDDLPRDFIATPEETLMTMAARSRATLRYQAQAMRRGAFVLSSIFLRVRSRWGCWVRLLRLPAEDKINVYPDMRQLSEYAILARTDRLSLMGLRRTRKVGQDNEFERLRDYTPDDNYKHLDWRATARRNKLTVKDYQVNQSQRVIFMLDCGRMMTSQCAGISLLDHALNAMLMLSYVALRQGDSAGLVCFSDEVHSFVPPRGGMRQMNQLIHASFDRFPRLVESRYDQAFLHLAARCKKRSLVVLVSNLIDEVNALQVYQYLSSMVGRHLPLAVLLKDRQLFDAVEVANPTAPQLFRAAAAADMIAWRHQILTDLTHRGVLCLDLFPEQMTAPLVNQYLEIKARHLL